VYTGKSHTDESNPGRNTNHTRVNKMSRSELMTVVDAVVPASAGYLAGAYVASQPAIVIAEVATVVVSRVALQVGATAIATPVASASVAGTVILLNPVVAGVIVGLAVFNLMNVLFGDSK
jgi:hypothetical protein